jgi:hypothetical protein
MQAKRPPGNGDRVILNQPVRTKAAWQLLPRRSDRHGVPDRRATTRRIAALIANPEQTKVRIVP